MHTILVLGAGRSASTLLRYLNTEAESSNWQVKVADLNLQLAEQKIQGLQKLEAIELNITDQESLRSEVKKVSLVISMLPARFHPIVAEICVQEKVHMVTASYISDEMHVLDQAAKDAGVSLMNEVGVDPGIDHMSAMRMLDRLRNEGAKFHCFESFTGGLLAPESEDNPWKYKFTWNPRNVVLAGQGGAVKFIHEGRYKYIPYHQLFRRTEVIDLEGFGRIEGYANRDSLWYREVYGLEDIPTIYRGTLRRPGFSKAWDIFVKLGATDDSYTLYNSEDMSYRQFINTFLAYHPSDSVELKLRYHLKIDQDSDVMEKLEWLGIFEETKIGLKDASPAQILQHILEQKWKMNPGDKDMIIMWHKVQYDLNGERKEVNASMADIGEDLTHTAMSRTVGLPVGIAAKMILNGEIKERGALLPTKPSIYNPILNELELHGIKFTEHEL